MKTQLEAFAIAAGIDPPQLCLEAWHCGMDDGVTDEALEKFAKAVRAAVIEECAEACGDDMYMAGKLRRLK